MYIIVGGKLSSLCQIVRIASSWGYSEAHSAAASSYLKAYALGSHLACSQCECRLDMMTIEREALFHMISQNVQCQDREYLHIPVDYKLKKTV